MRRITGLVLLAAVACAGGPGAAAEGGVARLGNARDPASGELIYTEKHEQIRGADGSLREIVTYLDPAGDLIATKHLDYSPARLLPDFRLENHRTGHVEGGRHVDGGYLVSFRSRAGAPLREKQLAIPTGAVADAGFDQLVTTHWDALLRGEVLVREFLVPGLQRFLRFRLRLDPASADTAGAMVREIVVEPASAVLRFVAEPLRLGYDVDGNGAPRLRRFQGVSNMRDGSGENHLVRIEFVNEMRDSLVLVFFPE